MSPQARREQLYSLLGDLPPRHRPVQVEVVAREERDCYRLEVLMLDLNGIEPVPAYFTTPLEAAQPRSRYPQWSTTTRMAATMFWAKTSFSKGARLCCSHLMPKFWLA